MFGNESESLNSYYYFNMKNETNMWANLFIQLIKINQTKCNQISKIKCVLKRKFALFNKIWWVLDTISIISKKSNKRKSFYIKKSHITFAFAFKKLKMENSLFFSIFQIKWTKHACCIIIEQKVALLKLVDCPFLCSQFHIYLPQFKRISHLFIFISTRHPSKQKKNK